MRLYCKNCPDKPALYLNLNTVPILSGLRSFLFIQDWEKVVAITLVITFLNLAMFKLNVYFCTQVPLEKEIPVSQRDYLYK